MAISTVPLEKRIHSTVVCLQQGDVTALPVDAVVFYAREDLALGSGHGTAIQVRGGDAVVSALKSIGSIRMGEAVITPAGKMNAQKIIHACGPKFQEPDTEKKLQDCMLAALNIADRQCLKSIAFPAMGAGFYGVPLSVCASVMLRTIRQFAEAGTCLERVMICVVDGREFAAFQQVWDKFNEAGGGPHGGRKPAAVVQ